MCVHTQAVGSRKDWSLLKSQSQPTRASTQTWNSLWVAGHQISNPLLATPPFSLPPSPELLRRLQRGHPESPKLCKHSNRSRAVSFSRLTVTSHQRQTKTETGRGNVGGGGGQGERWGSLGYGRSWLMKCVFWHGVLCSDSSLWAACPAHIC